MEDFYTIKENVSAEIVEKKSKFIANLFYVESKQKAEEIIKEIKKKYHDARHNCVAYRIIEDNVLLEKSSDDGEPSGTAGSPMLDLLRGNDLCNVLLIVTRYFGGILLGTGGLVKAYSESSQKAIEKSIKILQSEGYLAEVRLDYNNLDGFKYYCNNSNINIIDINYSDVVICKIEFSSNLKEKIVTDFENKKIMINDLKVICKKIVNKNAEK